MLQPLGHYVTFTVVQFLAIFLLATVLPVFIGPMITILILFAGYLLSNAIKLSKYTVRYFVNNTSYFFLIPSVSIVLEDERTMCYSFFFLNKCVKQKIYGAQ